MITIIKVLYTRFIISCPEVYETVTLWKKILIQLPYGRNTLVFWKSCARELQKRYDEQRFWFMTVLRGKLSTMKIPWTNYVEHDGCLPWSCSVLCCMVSSASVFPSSLTSFLALDVCSPSKPSIVYEVEMWFARLTRKSSILLHQDSLQMECQVLALLIKKLENTRGTWVRPSQ